jgi:choline-sulfatase
MKPDILLFLSDQHHAGYAGHCGHDLVRTPNLDRLAREGVVFENAYTPCPLCVPARTAFLTGQLPSQTGTYTNNGSIPEDQATFLHSLGAEGYDTVLCGRMHFIGADQRHGFSRRIMGEMTPLFSGRSGEARSDLGPYAGSMNNAGCLSVIGGGNSPVLEYDRAVIAAALDYLKLEHQRPQCIVVGTYAPHFTYVAPPELYRYYRSRVTVPLHHSELDGGRHPLVDAHRKEASEEVMLDARAAYFGMIENLDSQIGSVREAWNAYLSRSGRQGLFLYLSDHGDQAGEHHLYGKKTFYDGSARIPLVIAGDGIPAGIRRKGAVSMLDIGPTLCEFAGAQPPPEQAGVSLHPQLCNDVENLERAVISEFLEKDDAGKSIPGRMIRQGRWKLICYAGYEEHDLLFDMEKDPLEIRNARASYPEIYTILQERLYKDWDIPGIVRTAENKAMHYRLLAKWGKNSDAPEPERWPVPETAFHLPENIRSKGVRR